MPRRMSSNKLLFEKRKDAPVCASAAVPAPSGFFAYGANMLSEVVHNLNKLTSKKTPSSHGK